MDTVQGTRRMLVWAQQSVWLRWHGVVAVPVWSVIHAFFPAPGLQWLAIVDLWPGAPLGIRQLVSVVLLVAAVAPLGVRLAALWWKGQGLKGFNDLQGKAIRDVLCDRAAHPLGSRVARWTVFVWLAVFLVQVALVVWRLLTGVGAS